MPSKNLRLNVRLKIESVTNNRFHVNLIFLNIPSKRFHKKRDSLSPFSGQGTVRILSLWLIWIPCERIFLEVFKIKGGSYEANFVSDVVICWYRNSGDDGLLQRPDRRRSHANAY